MTIPEMGFRWFVRALYESVRVNRKQIFDWNETNLISVSKLFLIAVGWRKDIQMRDSNVQNLKSPKKWKSRRKKMWNWIFLSLNKKQLLLQKKSSFLSKKWWRFCWRMSNICLKSHGKMFKQWIAIENLWQIRWSIDEKKSEIE